MATARCPWRGLGQGPVVPVARFHFSMGAAMMFITHNAHRPRTSPRILSRVSVFKNLFNALNTNFTSLILLINQTSTLKIINKT